MKAARRAGEDVAVDGALRCPVDVVHAHTQLVGAGGRVPLQRPKPPGVRADQCGEGGLLPDASVDAHLDGADTRVLVPGATTDGDASDRQTYAVAWNVDS